MKATIFEIKRFAVHDGDGIRTTVFFKGCPLRCVWCHNPEGLSFEPQTAYYKHKCIGCGECQKEGFTASDCLGEAQVLYGRETTVDELIGRIVRYRNYFGNRGGVTVSGGEPLCQAAFAKAVFELCHERGIHTCLDTSGAVLNDAVRLLLAHCDRVLLDIKYTEDDLYRRFVGMPLENALTFLAYLDEQKIPTTIRQVVIPTVNDTTRNFEALRKIADTHACVDNVELLPFRKICQVKYEAMGRPFPFADIPEADPDAVRRNEEWLNA